MWYKELIITINPNVTKIAGEMINHFGSNFFITFALRGQLIMLEFDKKIKLVYGWIKDYKQYTERTACFFN